MKGAAVLVTIEQAKVNDVESVLQLDFQVLGSAERSDFLVKSISECSVWMASDEGVVVGFVVADQSFFGEFFIELLIVHPSFRRKGIGALLVNKIETILSVEKLFTSTNVSNVPMQRLCESLGFTKSGYIENLDDGDPEIVYVKRHEN